MAGDQGYKQTRGKQKIAMKMIDNEDDRHITFSKRRTGIFKKASEIVTLCGSEVVVVIFSPSGKPFSFGHLSPDAVIDKFIANSNGAPVDSASNAIVKAFRRRKIEDLNELNDSLLERLEEEKALQRALKKKLSEVLILHRRKQRQAMSEEDEEDGEEEEEEEAKKDKREWWEVPLKGLAEDALKEKYRFFQELHKKFSSHVKERIVNANSTCSGANVAPLSPCRGAESCSGEGSEWRRWW